MGKSMSYVIEKHIVKKYEVTDVWPFLKYGTFSPARKKIGLDTPKTCFRCGHKFVESDILYLGVVKSDKNRIFCETCGEHIRKCLDIQQHKEG